jgi:hypothetical protein
MPTPAQLEDSFLAALGAQSVPRTLQLVGEYWNVTDTILPAGQGVKSMLSQAVLLTCLHRVSG